MRKILILMFISMLFLTGCAATKDYRATPFFENYFNNPRKITIMPPDIEIHLLTAGGIDEIRDEWSDIAKVNVLNAIREELSSLPLVKTSLLDLAQLNEADKEFVKEQNGLYNAVAASIIWHTYLPGSTFKHKLDNFDYTLGADIAHISDSSEPDGLLFCAGQKYVWTAGRTSTAIFGLLVGAATGVYFIPGSGPEFIVVSLVDAKTGDVIWFNYKPSQVDWRDGEVCRENIKKLFRSFPNEDK